MQTKPNYLTARRLVELLRPRTVKELTRIIAKNRATFNPLPLGWNSKK
jgi:hypothetical protein